MKKIFNLSLMLIAFSVFSIYPVYSQSYAEDTVWTKITDQSMGFYQVKFSNNDSIIVGHGYENAIFYNALNGEEISRIPFNAEVYFIDNDNKYIQPAPTRNKLIIYDTKTHIQLDTLENDGKMIGKIDISKDERFITGVITGGLRIWSLETKRIFLTKLFDNIPGLININVGQVKYYCDDSKILIQIDKTYQISVSPPKQTTENNITIFDANTLDSINNFYGYFDFRLSRTCLYIAFMTLETTYGVDIYNFNTKKLIRRLPINGPSLTGIEFSPDDKYIVTSNGPGANSLIIWDVVTGQNNYSYPSGSYDNMDVSNDGKKIVTSTGLYLFLLNAKFGGTPVPSIPEINRILYPNPSSGEVNIDNEYSGKIKIFNSIGNLQAEIEPSTFENGFRFNVSNLPNGVYIVVIEGKATETYKLIINK